MIGTDSLPSSPDGGRDGALSHPALLSVAVALVLIIELVWPRTVNLSWQVVALFALLVFVVGYRDLGGLDLPAVGNGLGDDIRSVRNELDAAIEVTTRQARALSDGDEPSPLPGPYPPDELEGLTDELYDMLVEDPTLSVAKLRNELEMASRRPPGPDAAGSDGASGLDAGAVVAPIAEVYPDVLDLYARAIEEEGIRLTDGINLVDLGIDLYRYLVHTGYDATLRSGSTYWVGTRVRVAGTGIDPGAVYDLHRLDDPADDARLGLVASRCFVDADGESVIDTAGLSPGSYAILDDGAPIEFGIGGRTHRDAEIEAARFEFADQSFSASFASGWALNQGEKTTDALALESNRGRYLVWVTVEELSEDELRMVFGSDDAFIGTFSRDDGGVAALRGARDSTISADVTDVDPGEYEFELAIPDTGKTAEASLSVQTF